MIKEFHIKVTPEELLIANQEMKKYLKESEGYPSVPHVMDLIKDLHAHGLRLIIASSSSPEEIEAVMDALKIRDEFEGYVSGMMVSNPKPSPDIFLAAVAKLQINPSECIVIEDSMNGVNAAFAAGITCIGFVNPNSGNQDLSKAAMLAEGFEEIDYKFMVNIYDEFHREAKAIITTTRLILRELIFSRNMKYPGSLPS